MKERVTHQNIHWLLLCGMIGCILMGGGDWLMIYGDTAYEGSLAWLTVGVANIAPWRNAAAMMLAFPAVIFYSIALMGIRHFLRQKEQRSRYTSLTVVGMTPWLCLHLFYVMILFLYGWMSHNGYEAAALASCEALFRQFAWLVPVADVLMLLPFLYLMVVIAKGKSVFPRWMALNNPLVIFVLMKLFVGFLNDTPARLAFLNGLMSESMLIWFLIFILLGSRYMKKL